MIGGYVRWGDYKPGASIRVKHHKTGQMVIHPLSDDTTAFYPEAEEVLASVPKRGLAIVLGEGKDVAYKPARFAQLVRRVADREMGHPGLPHPGRGQETSWRYH